MRAEERARIVWWLRAGAESPVLLGIAMGLCGIGVGLATS